MASQTKVVHRLLLPGCEAKIKYWQRFQESVFNGLLDQELIFYFDKEWFTLNSYANSQNNRHWTTDNHHAVHEVPLHDLKSGVWCSTGALWGTMKEKVHEQSALFGGTSRDMLRRIRRSLWDSSIKYSILNYSRKVGHKLLDTVASLRKKSTMSAVWTSSMTNCTQCISTKVDQSDSIHFPDISNQLNMGRKPFNKTGNYNHKWQIWHVHWYVTG